MRIVNRGLLASLPRFLLAGAGPLRAESDSAAVSAWMKRTANPFATCEPVEDQRDLAFLKKLVGDAHIVSLGEGTHGTREFFQMKHRITRYLASEMGFSVFAIEANMPEAYRLNDYVLTGRGDPKALLAGMYFWTWNTEEVLALIEWMRAFNASGKGRMQFTGFDMQTPDTAAAIARRALAKVDAEAVDSLDRCLTRLQATRLASQTGRGSGADRFATATAMLPAGEFAGHRVRYSGWIRTQEVDGFAGLWMRADGAAMKTLAFDNMQGQQVNGTRDWQRYSIELEIPKSTEGVYFGMLMSGSGTAWFDSLASQVDGDPWTGSGYYGLAIDGDEHPAGFSNVTGPAFQMAMDREVHRVGGHSLRIRRVQPASARVEPDPANVDPPPSPVALASWLLDRAISRRDALARATSPAEADWAIQNVRVVEQCARMYEGGRGYLVRDSSMAENVDWILAHEPKGTRIVLWAHNGHVARNPGWMGSHLARPHGSDMVVIGFAAFEGQYTAIKQGTGLRSDNVLTPPTIECFESLAQSTGLPRFVLDLRRRGEDAAAKRWFSSPRMMRSIGAMAMDTQFHPTVIARDFDAIVFASRTTATKATRVVR